MTHVEAEHATKILEIGTALTILSIALLIWALRAYHKAWRKVDARREFKKDLEKAMRERDERNQK